MCDPPPPPHPTPFAIIPRIWTHYRTRPNTSAPNQGQAPFWFHTNTRTCWSEKNLTNWRLLLLAQIEGQFLHLSQPQVWQNQLLKCTWHVVCPLQSPCVPSVSSNPSVLERREKNGWSLPLVLFNYCFVVQDVQEMSPLSSLKTLESVHMHCELGKSLSCHFTYRHAYRVTEGSRRSVQNLPFTFNFPMPTLLFKEVFKGTRCERARLWLRRPLKYVSARAVPTTSDWSRLIDSGLSLSMATPRCALCRQPSPPVTGNQTSA